ncbi:uncharacterized protein BJ212DRAFT_1326222 [Suillus subaureus]|uniref:Secreted protein n=1 Tax=Suillus subaureus TaxID=48587 RepID=A0A9P7EK08_9AGAM|nr:uncharacterized protein BJ212DRAFT_1326222 [Suillus subaureus]KAG1823716.1 hypothetical protein BJ212DRAFT_1326222 [Suillus subaureus]
MIPVSVTMLSVLLLRMILHMAHNRRCKPDKQYEPQIANIDYCHLLWTLGTSSGPFKRPWIFSNTASALAGIEAVPVVGTTARM